MKVGNNLVKRLLGSLLGTAILTLALLGLEARPLTPYQTIVELEAQRSLGGGTLANFLESRDRELAARAALAIGRSKDSHGVPLLQKHLQDNDMAVRALSVYGLGLLATGASTDRIITMLYHDRSSAVRVAAVDALSRYEAAKNLRGRAEANVAGALVAVMKADQDPRVRGRTAAALETFRTGPLADLVSRELVSAFRTERNDDVRWHLMWTIFRGYAVRVPREVLHGALSDHNELVRIEAVRAYGRVKSKDATAISRAIAALQPLTRDPSWRVQLQALESIKILSGKDPTEHLTQMPAGIHVPTPPPIKITEIAPLPRPNVSGKPAAPTAEQAIYRPKLYPTTSALMDGPMPGPHPRVRIKTTKGTLIVTLYPEWAPLTVANFLNLAGRGYYDGNRWFRIVPDFVVQTGDPNDNGEGDAGFSVPAEENPLEQRSYVISMGLNYKDNAPIRDSAGTQYYITLSPQLHLNRDFTVFGEVTAGFDVLGRLVESDRNNRVEQIPDSP